MPTIAWRLIALPSVLLALLLLPYGRFVMRRFARRSRARALRQLVRRVLRPPHARRLRSYLAITLFALRANGA